MARFFVVALSLFLFGCASGTPIKDFTNRSVVYSWVDIKDISGNKLMMFQMRNLSVQRGEKYQNMAWEKVGNGYLVWHQGYQPGRWEVHRLQTMACAGPLCSNTINEYGFGPDGTSAIRTIVEPGKVHFMGCYAFKRTKRGFFRPGEFDTRKTACGASKKQMLSVILQNAEDPVVVARLKRAMR